MPPLCRGRGVARGLVGGTSIYPWGGAKPCGTLPEPPLPDDAPPDWLLAPGPVAPAPPRLPNALGLDVKVSDGFNALRDLKASDPKVQAAFKACQSTLPQRPGDGHQQTTTSSST